MGELRSLSGVAASAVFGRDDRSDPLALVLERIRLALLGGVAFEAADIGAVVFAASTMKVWERGIYWVVNSLIIFSMGVGATNIAANVAAQQASNEHSTSVAAAILSAFAGTAFAQDGKASLPPASVPKNQAPVTTAASQPKPSSEAALRARIKELESRISVLKADKESSLSEVIELRRKANAAATPPSNEIAGKSAPEGFFKRW